MVGRQLHDERGRIAGEHLRLLEHDAGDDDRGHADEVRGGGDPGAAAEEGAGDHADEGHFRAAGDKGGGHDRHAAITLVFNGTGSHNARHAAADADEHRDEGLAAQAELTEDTVEHEGDTGHVAAGLEEGQHQEQDEHLRHEAEHRADTGDNAVEDQALQPVGAARLLQTVADQDRDARNPDAVVGRIGRVKAVGFEVGDRIDIRHAHGAVLVGVIGDVVVVGGHFILSQGLLILDHGGRGVGGGLEGFHFREGGVGVEVFGFGVETQERVDRFGRGGVFVVGVVISARADAQQVPAVAEHAVVGPVGRGRADGDHGDPVDQEHDHGEDRQAQPAVGDDAVDLIGRGLRGLGFLAVAGADDFRDVDVALVGDDGLGIVVELFLGGLDVRLDVLVHILGDVELSEHLVVALKDLDRVPALLLFRHLVHGRLFDVGDRVLDRAGERVHRHGLGGLGGLDGGFCRGHDAVTLQGRDLHDLAAELLRQLADVDLVAALAHDVHHVHGHDHRDAQFGQLRGQVQVALEVRAVHDVEDGVRTLVDQIVAGDDLFERVRAERVDAGKVHDDNVVMLFQAAFLFLDRDARPVAHKLIGAGQRIEQRRFAAVRVAG